MDQGLYSGVHKAYDRRYLFAGTHIPVRREFHMVATAPTKQQQKAVYQLEGTLLEVCSCGILCPCWVGEDPDGGECFSFLSHSFKQGQIDGIDVSGLSIVSVVHIPGN